MDILLGLLRTLLAALGGWAVAQGYIDAEQVEPIIGALLLLAAAVWSIASKLYHRRKYAGGVDDPSSVTTTKESPWT